jgi:LmbE family N-acetylglucosaminyl deacetylase
VIALRRRELEASCRVLGVSDLELLGYHDSGMEGWPQNDAPDAFWHTPVAQAAKRLADLMRTYQPQVVVTYDENGFYGHPDHIQANRVTHAAIAESGVPAKLYYTALPRSRLAGFGEILAEAGIERPAEVEENPDFGTPDELITTTVDVSAVAGLVNRCTPERSGGVVLGPALHAGVVIAEELEVGDPQHRATGFELPSSQGNHRVHIVALLPRLDSAGRVA